MPKEKDGPVQGHNPQPPKKDKKKIEGQKSAASLPVHAPYYLDASRNKKKIGQSFQQTRQENNRLSSSCVVAAATVRMYFYKNLIIIERYISIEGKTPSLRSCYRAITTRTLSRTWSPFMLHMKKRLRFCGGHDLNLHIIKANQTNPAFPRELPTEIRQSNSKRNKFPFLATYFHFHLNSQFPGIVRDVRGSSKRCISEASTVMSIFRRKTMKRRILDRGSSPLFDPLVPIFF